MRVSQKGMIFVFVILSIAVMVLFMSGRDAGAQLQNSRVCFQAGCHNSNQWLDNNPPGGDVTSHDAFFEYLPPNLSPSPTIRPFYRISQGYLGSIHNIPAFDPSITDEVKCTGCHISVAEAHPGGLGSLPDAGTCRLCHSDIFLPYSETAHANQNNTPGKFFDVISNGRGRATTSFPSMQSPVTLFKKNRVTLVNNNQRIEECSVCHDYALEYPIYKGRIAGGNIPEPQVGCPACHDGHIPAPDGNHLPVVTTTVKVTAVSGNTVLAVTPGQGRQVTYRDLKPYRINSNGAQDLGPGGTWDRGGSFIGPNLALVSGTGTIENGAGTSDQFTFSGGGALEEGSRPRYAVDFGCGFNNGYPAGRCR